MTCRAQLYGSRGFGHLLRGLGGGFGAAQQPGAALVCEAIAFAFDVERMGQRSQQCPECNASEQMNTRMQG
jgi:hypothetical protein